MQTIRNKEKKLNIFSLAVERKRYTLKKQTTYQPIYITILKEIEKRNSVGKTTLVYSVPSILPFSINYNQIECLKYCEQKLKANLFDCRLIEEQGKIVICWKHDLDNDSPSKINGQKLLRWSSVPSFI